MCSSIRFRLVLLVTFSAFFLSVYISFHWILWGLVFIFGSAWFVWRKYFLGLCFLFFAVLLIVSFRIGYYFVQDALPHFHYQPVRLEGRVDSFMDNRERNNRFYFLVDSVEHKGRTLETHSRILVTVTADKSFGIGERLDLLGTVKPPPRIKDFDYAWFLRRHRVQSVMRPQKIISVQPAQGISTLAQVWRYKIAENLRSYLPDPHSSIALGVLVGIKTELPENTQRDFNLSGLQHLLVVSGTNVTLIVVALSFLLQRFGRYVVYGVSLFFIVFYCLICGAEAPVVRAGVMGGLVGLAVVLGRPVDFRYLLLWTGVLLGIFDPLMVGQDVGFFLSFMATVGILLGLPVLQKYTRQWPDPFKITSLLQVSLVAQVSVFPILIVYFGQFPFVGLVANIFAEPIIPCVMLLGALLSFLAFIPGVGWCLSIPLFLLLEGLLQLARIMALVPPWTVPSWCGVVVLGVFLGLVVWALLSEKYETLFLLVEQTNDSTGETVK